MPGKVNHKTRALAYIKEGKLSRLQKLFLATYENNPSVFNAAEKCGIHYKCHYNWLQVSSDYSIAFEKARETIGDRLEAECIRAAMEGDPVPIVGKDGIRQWWNKKSDVMRIFTTKGFKPQYRDNPQLALTVNTTPPVINFNIVSKESTKDSTQVVEVGTKSSTNLVLDDLTSSTKTSK